MPKINSYPDAFTTVTDKTIDLLYYLDSIRTGEWQIDVMRVRQEADPEKQKKLKKKLPLVTVSGQFSSKEDAAILEHSGYIAIDVDKPKAGPQALISALRNDRYTFSSFVSTRGKGVCIIVKIDPNKHREAYRGYMKYLYDTYRELADASCINESRARFVSYDPEIHINEEALTFKKYPPKEKDKKIPTFVHVEGDFADMVNALAPHNICEDYHAWHSIGNALCDKYGEGGRQYFHILSASASTYDNEVCDAQFDLIKKYQGSATKRATVGTIYYYAKQFNIPFYSERTKEIIGSTSMLRKSGLQPQAIIENLEKFQQIPASESAEIVNAAFAAGIDLKDDNSVLNDIEKWLTFNYELRYNIVKLRVEVAGQEMSQRVFNNMWVQGKKVFDKDLNTETLDKIINSSLSREYSPLLEFFDRYKDRQPTGVIYELFDCIDTDTGMSEGEFFPTFAFHFGRKWLVSLIAAAHGENSPLMLVLCGRKTGTGKTEFFRRLLPPELVEYFDNFKIDTSDKDTFIKMCTYWLLLDDEMGGRSNKDAIEFKSLSSRDKMSVRQAYGRYAEMMHRLCVLCATSNEEQVVNDDDNRRIIPIRVLAIDKDRYNKVDKIDLLIEAYHLYKTGFDWRILDEEKVLLHTHTGEFRQVDPEIEALTSCFRKPGAGEFGDFKTTTMLYSHIVTRYPGTKITVKRLGQLLLRAGFQQSKQRLDDFEYPVRCFCVVVL